MMTVDLIQSMFEYHYARLRQVWDSIMALDEERFFDDVPYSLGSLRNHMMHLIDDDIGWISLVEGKDRPPQLSPENFTSRDDVRRKYDETEKHILSVINGIDKDRLQQIFVWKPPFAQEKQYVTGEQILIHVVNHGTDHRAQVLRVLHDFGATTFDQDVMGYWYRTGRLIAKKY